MATNQDKMEHNPSAKTSKTLVLIQISLRLLAFAAAIAATLIMTMSKQTVEVYGFIVEAKYSYSSTFRFFVGTNAAGSAYALFSIPFVFMLSSKGADSRGSFFLFVFDLIIAGLMMAAASAATAIGYLGKKGNSHTGWSPICDHVGRFCNMVGGSIFCSFAAVIVFFLLTVVSATKVRQVPVSSY